MENTKKITNKELLISVAKTQEKMLNALVDLTKLLQPKVVNESKKVDEIKEVSTENKFASKKEANTTIKMVDGDANKKDIKALKGFINSIRFYAHKESDYSQMVAKNSSKCLIAKLNEMCLTLKFNRNDTIDILTIKGGVKIDSLYNNNYKGFKKITKQTINAFANK